jgi:hypothetical protein
MQRLGCLRRCRGLLGELRQKVAMVATPAGLCKANRVRGEVWGKE